MTANEKRARKKAARGSIRRAGEHRRRSCIVKALIPARGGSKGIARKNIMMIEGYPMLAHSILTLSAAGINEVWVSTENEEIGQLARIYGAKVLNRPEHLADDSATTEAVVEHFFTKISCDVLVLVQCTSPMLQPQYIINGLNKLFACGLSSIFSVVKTNDMLIWDKHLRALNYSPQRRGRRQTRRDCTYIESGAFYIFTRSMFLREKCRIGGRYGISEVPFWQSFQVDNKKDLAMIRKLMEKR